MAGREGEQLGNYRLVRLLGHGGFADVYLGEHLYIRKQAAIKVLHARLAEGTLDAFRREAQIIADLRHPHIVHLFDFALQDNLPFLIMDYYADGSLRKRYPSGSRLPVATVVNYARQVADALQYAHERRVIHRDVKPENMLLGPGGEIILTDFGIAAVAHSTTAANLDIFAGTPYYMAPEQISKMPQTASDQYALATVVYEWLTGSVPFRGTVKEVLAKQLVSEPQPLRALVPELNEDLERVILTALAKEPEQRFATVQAFAVALTSAAQAVPAVVRVTPVIDLRNDAGLASASPTWREELVQPPDVLIDQPRWFSAQQLERAKLPTAGMRPLPPASSQQPRKKSPRLLAALTFLLALIMVGGSAFFVGDRLQQGQRSAQTTPNTLVRATTTSNPGSPGSQQTTVANTQAAATATFTAAHPYPSYMPGHGQLAFYDPISLNSNWEQDVNRQKTGECEFLSGSYYATMTQQGYRWCGDYTTDTDYTSFAYQVDLSIINGDCGGLLFRWNGTTDVVYMFVICQWGEQDLFISEPSTGDLRLLENGSNQAAIHAGLHQSNLIGVVAQGTTITLYVNGKQVSQLQDSSSTAGGVGVAAVDQTVATAVTFRDATLWTL